MKNTIKKIKLSSRRNNWFFLVCLFFGFTSHSRIIHLWRHHYYRLKASNFDLYVLLTEVQTDDDFRRSIMLSHYIYMHLHVLKYRHILVFLYLGLKFGSNKSRYISIKYPYCAVSAQCRE